MSQSQDSVLADLLEAAGIPAARGPHVFAMQALFVLADEDEAQRVAAARPADRALAGGWWDPGRAPDQVFGPVCIACGCVRGPKPASTLCEGQEPPWLRQRKADENLAALPRSERREVQRKVRREERRQRASSGAGGYEPDRPTPST